MMNKNNLKLLAMLYAFFSPSHINSDVVDWLPDAVLAGDACIKNSYYGNFCFGGQIGYGDKGIIFAINPIYRSPYFFCETVYAVVKLNLGFGLEWSKKDLSFEHFSCVGLGFKFNPVPIRFEIVCGITEFSKDIKSLAFGINLSYIYKEEYNFGVALKKNPFK